MHRCIPPLDGSSSDRLLVMAVNNLHSLPSDCPTREKRGWLGDAQVTAAEGNLNFDMVTFMDNFVRSVSDHNTDGHGYPHGDAELQCNPLPLQADAASLPYNCCASVESVALPKLAVSSQAIFLCLRFMGIVFDRLLGLLNSMVARDGTSAAARQAWWVRCRLSSLRTR